MPELDNLTRWLANQRLQDLYNDLLLAVHRHIDCDQQAARRAINPVIEGIWQRATRQPSRHHAD